MNCQLDQSEKLIESLNNQLYQEKDRARNLEYQIEDLERDTGLKNDEIDSLQSNLRAMKEVNFDMEKIGRDKENLVRL